ncbi:MAG: NAD-dependent epimerase/dehydratase family protein [Desulfobacteraceae bacterium]|nr:MAG: NAD-dependent epimerase/dehydratase family protein [Desulfobacteraceae bacterium]
MNVLITGGAGFIGSHTCDSLIRRGHRVRIVDNLQRTVHPKGKPDYLHPEAEFIRGDVRRKQVWKTALKGIDAVYHFAAYQDYLVDFSTFFHVNSVSTALLYEVLVEEGRSADVRKVIVASSQAVMGEGRYRCPECFVKSRTFIYPQIRVETELSKGIWDHRCEDCGTVLEWVSTDETVANPCNPYALSKYSQEQIAIQLGRRYSIPTVALRYSIVQGARQSLYNAYSGAMRIFALSLRLGKAPTIFEDGNQTRDFVNIEDVVQANLLVLDRKEADGNVYNVGGGVSWTVNRFYDEMQRVVGKSIPPVVSCEYRYGDTRHIFSDTRKLQSIGWEARRGIEDSIGAYWEYLCRQDRSDDILDYARRHMRRLQVIRQARRKIR